MLDTICNSIIHTHVQAFKATEKTFQNSQNFSGLKFLKQYSVFRNMQHITAE